MTFHWTPLTEATPADGTPILAWAKESSEPSFVQWPDNSDEWTHWMEAGDE